MKFSNHFFLLLTIVAISFSACSNDDDTPDPASPALPDLSSFIMNFDDFDESGRMMDTTQHNWTHAAVHVGVWNTILTVGLAVPATAFRESFNHQAVWNPNNNYWTWSYNFVAQNVIHSAELRAFLDGDNVNWEMRISKQGAFTDFLWYSGVSMPGNTEGNWMLFDNPNDPSELLDITWHRSSEDVADIQYTNIKPGAPENGSYIYFDTTIDPIHNRNYDIFAQEQSNLVQIEWHETTKNGRVNNPQHFGNDEWQCWDSGLVDIDCP